MTACCTFYCHWFYSPILISTVRDRYVSCIVDVERALWLQLFDDVSEETGVSIFRFELRIFREGDRWIRLALLFSSVLLSLSSYYLQKSFKIFCTYSCFRRSVKYRHDILSFSVDVEFLSLGIKFFYFFYSPVISGKLLMCPLGRAMSWVELVLRKYCVCQPVCNQYCTVL